MSGEFYTANDHFVLKPALLMALFGCATLLFDLLFVDEASRRKLRPLSVVAAELFVGFALWGQQSWLTSNGLPSFSAFGGALTLDGFSLFFNWILAVATLIVAIVSYRYLDSTGENHTEYYSLLLFAQCGMFFLVSGTDLVTLFIGLELMALCFYIMVGFLRSEKRSNEAAMKYLLLGAFSSGFLAYGFSVMYGISGSTKLVDIATAIAQRQAWDPIVFLAMATTAVGLLF